MNFIKCSCGCIEDKKFLYFSIKKLFQTKIQFTRQRNFCFSFFFPFNPLSDYKRKTQKCKQKYVHFFSILNKNLITYEQTTIQVFHAEENIFDAAKLFIVLIYLNAVKSYLCCQTFNYILK